MILVLETDEELKEFIKTLNEEFEGFTKMEKQLSDRVAQLEQDKARYEKTYYASTEEYGRYKSSLDVSININMVTLRHVVNLS